MGFLSHYNQLGERGVAHWLRHCATTPTVAGSMVLWEFFIDLSPSGRTMALMSTQPVKDVSNRNISSGVKAAVA